MTLLAFMTVNLHQFLLAMMRQFLNLELSVFMNDKAKCKRRRRRASPQVGIETTVFCDYVFRISRQGSFGQVPAERNSQNPWVTIRLKDAMRCVRGFWCPCAWCLLERPPGGAAEPERQRLTMRPLLKSKNLVFCDCLCDGWTNVGCSPAGLNGVSLSLSLTTQRVGAVVRSVRHHARWVHCSSRNKTKRPAAWHRASGHLCPVGDPLLVCHTCKV